MFKKDHATDVCLLKVKWTHAHTRKMKVFLCVSVIVLCTINSAAGEVLTPPYFNLAQGRRITASSTCGEGTNEPELYCKLVGANADTDININVIQGQVCDFCDERMEGRMHPAEYAIDGSERWWQSPPLSRGVKYNEVNLTIDLGQEFHVAYVLITMANSPRPGVWVLERSNDNGETYEPWQYFADTLGDCENFFGVTEQRVTEDDTVTCDTAYSKVVPLEGGEIFLSLLNNRPSASDFFSSDVLQEWTRATNIRLRFLRTKTLLGHLMSVARQDPTVTRRYFYSIKDISIGGRCRCNGHAGLCDITDPQDPYKLLCRCEHNTCGAQCETCCPNFVQKAWRPSTFTAPFICEPCNCYGHSRECYYDPEVDQNKTSVDQYGNYEGGGVCINCRDNTEGINCDKCKSGYYRPNGKALDAPDVCQPCQCDNYYSTGDCIDGSGKCICKDRFTPPDCDSCNVGYYSYPECKPCDCHINGTRGALCEVGGGQCPCKQNFAGKNCDRCAEGFYNFPDCLPCECEDISSVSPVCDPQGGQCECGNKYGGRRCNECEDGYYNFPTCTYCSCDIRGAGEGICDKNSGSCLCKEGYGGARCDQCVSGYYGYPDCRPCNCSTVGSASTVCDATGKCPCLPNFSGRTCNQCTPGYYQFPECLSCNCNIDGSMGVSCDDEGKCQCKPNFDGLHCEDCKQGFYNFPACEECNCDPAGVLETFRGCGDSPPGELCQCKERVTGRICNECKPLFWNLQEYNPNGCQDCECYLPGVLGGVQDCEGKGGQCPCKPHVFLRQCDECQNGYFNLTAQNVLGCSNCGCDVGGSVSNICDKVTGQCPCHPRIDGRTCTEPLQAHYYPTLYQFQYEAEDGVTPTGGPLRVGYDNEEFPGFSWRGYAIYSQLQPITNHTVDIDKSSLYRVVIKYLNPGDQTVSVEVIATPDNTVDVEQKYKVRLEPGSGFVTVSTGNIPSPFVLNPGRWNLAMHTDKFIMIDYFTLLPAAYYEGSILQQKVNDPCMIDRTADGNKISPDPCVKLTYPSIDDFDKIYGTDGYFDDGGIPTVYFEDKDVLNTLEIDVDRMVLLNPDQRKLNFDLPVNKGGRYALVLEYFTPEGSEMTKLNVEATSPKGMTKGEANIYDCRLSTVCRSVVTTEDGEVVVFRFGQSSIDVVVEVPEDSENTVALESISAIPLGKWSLDYIHPKEFCVMKDGECVDTGYGYPPESVKVEAEVDSPDRIVEADEMPQNVKDANLVVLDDRNRSLNIKGMVPTSGYYTLLVHYHQPENPDFSMEVVIQNGQHYMAQVPMLHCPDISGCRAVVAQDDENSKFFIDDDFYLTLKSPKKVWIDYVLAVPAVYEDNKQLNKYLQPRPLDKTAKFIAECGQEHFYLTNETSEFCKNAVFSLTSDYNNGALPCQCDFDGSKSFSCEQFGGQCECKEHVIGRRCERCAAGYFGFPNCKPCDCPSTSLCDPVNGECICPDRVIGEKCDECAPFTYGFDPYIGCEECGCSPLGSLNGDLQCDLFNGSCTCKANVVGRTCDRCQAGYWAFPHCQNCKCDIRGTTQDICSQDTAECFCKANVEGRGCDQCEEGSFNLQQENPEGCTDCFCFGKTARCISTSKVWTQIGANFNLWSATVLNPMQGTSHPQTDVEINYQNEEDEGFDGFAPIKITFANTPLGNETNVLYFKASLEGSFLTSYGGMLKYKVKSRAADDSVRETYGAPDVILEGTALPPYDHTIRLMHYAIDHVDGEDNMNMALQLIEENFSVTSQTGGLITASREQIMTVLKSLTGIYIRAGYWKETFEPLLNEFSLQVAIDDNSYGAIGQQAVTVEHCQCPPNYRGLSCEECSPGYYRSPAGPFGGFCIPCQCNGHSRECDAVTGVCLNCEHNTMGDHCEMCAEGYHGDAQVGTPHDCLICACPMPVASNNFATSCDMSYDGRLISCECKEPYIGPRCEACGPGFYGNPEAFGETCKPCDCSGNIDVNDPYACDSVTGACLQCLNNTGGPACNLCARGYFGDAVFAKDCQTCSCNDCGTYECDHSSGDCQCLNNVIGLDCDKCAPDHWGLSLCDGAGCRPCECGIASAYSQCDDATGQCTCKKGTTGQRCERCAPGYWNYTSDGCQACECNQEYAIGVGCNPENGQCSCLPGVVGKNCDRCPHRWVLIEDRGCQGCDNCQHQLLDETDAMAAILDPVKQEFESVAVSYFTTQKLAYFNTTVDELEPEVRLLDPSTVDINPFYEDVLALESEANSYRQQAEVIEDSLKGKKNQVAKLREKSFKVESDVQESVAKSSTAVFETKDLTDRLLADETPISSPQVDAARAEAETIIDAMQKVEFDPSEAMEENDKVDDVLRDIKEYVKPMKALDKELAKEKKRIEKIKEKLRDLSNQSDYSIKTAIEANEIADQIKDNKFPSKVDILKGLTKEMMDHANNASSANSETPGLIADLDQTYINLESVLSSVKEMKEPLSQNVETLKNELENNKDTIPVSHRHATMLKMEADRLDRMLGETRAVSENAVAAGTAYQNIIEALGEAKQSAEKAKDNSENATAITSGLGDEANRAMEPSQNLLILAGESLKQVEVELKIPLKDAKMAIDRIDELNADTKEFLEDLNKDLDEALPLSDLDDVIRSEQVSKDAVDKAIDAENAVEDILNKLPEQNRMARKLRVTVNDMNKGVDITHNQLNQAKDSVPLSSAITGSLESKQPMLDEKKNELANSLAELKAKIAAAREQAKRIPVGMNLQDSSYLQLENPGSLDNQQKDTQVSLHFRTQEPEGLLMFLGTEQGKKETDYMAIEIENGYPVLTMDLGSGPQRIMNQKFVADNQWYKASVNRAGKTVKFVIEEEDQYGNTRETVKEDYLPGTKSLFNVDKNSSKLFIGGLPPGEQRIPVRSSTYRGNVEDLTIGGEKVGLWNFKDSDNLAPSVERDRFVNLKPETGLRFQGNGYAIVSSRLFPIREQSDIAFKFKTKAKTGLLFLAGKGRKFMSIELVDGNLLFQYNLGGGTATIVSQGRFNDGEWHRVEAIRQRQRSILRVDGRDEGSAMSPGKQYALSVSDFVYFGGYPGEHSFSEVTNKDFEGCIEDVLVERRPLDLTQAVETRSTIMGCPASYFSPSIATFSGNGFIQVDAADAPVNGPQVIDRDETFELNFKFRGNDTHGLLFYGADADNDNYLSVSMAEGALHVKTEPGGSYVKTDTLNDGKWHVVTVTRSKDALFVNIDDQSEFSQVDKAGPLSISAAGSTMFFGGRPASYPISMEATVADTPFKGCMGDITINGKRVDFSDAIAKESSLNPTCLNDQEMEDAFNNVDIGSSRTIPEPDDNDFDDDDEDVESSYNEIPEKGPEVSEEDDDYDDIEEPIIIPPKVVTPTTTTERPRKIPIIDDETPPPPFEQCSLSYRQKPEKTQQVSLEDGVMFGNFDRSSRMEFIQPIDDGSRSEYSIEFKTTEPNGLIFMWTEVDKIDFMALFLRRGFLHFAFDSGSGPAFLNSTQMFNDSKWHSVQFTRYLVTGELIVDGSLMATGNSSGGTSNINAGNLVSIGGLPDDDWSRKMTQRKLLFMKSPFRGCLRNFKIKNKVPLPAAYHSVQKCSDQYERGFYFYPNSGYLALHNRFMVGRNIKMSMSIKPRHPSGILVAVHGEIDYMVLQMINGTIRFTVDNGKGALYSSFSKQPYDLCDGQWHTIRVSKSKNVVTLALDNTYSTPGIGAAGKDTTNTRNPLYVGGHPDPANTPGFLTTEQYVGCMKDFEIERRQLKFTHDKIIGTVGIHSCPTD